MSYHVPLTDHHVLAVDAWSHPPTRGVRPARSVAAHFLTHAHGDHMAGLGDAWAGAAGEETPVYCSPVTAAVVSARFPALGRRCVPVGPGGRVEVQIAGDTVATVDAVDAGHCAVSGVWVGEGEKKRSAFQRNKKANHFPPPGLPHAAHPGARLRHRAAHRRLSH